MITKVTLREKPIADGAKKSLYLDFYPAIVIDNKETRREFLSLHTFTKPKTAADKQHNRTIEQQAEHIRYMRENELNKPEIYDDAEKEHLRRKEAASRSFIEYFQQIADSKEGSSKRTWEAALFYLKQFSNDNLTFGELTEKKCNDFKKYLLTAKLHKSGRSTIVINTARIYFSKLKMALKEAYQDRLIAFDLSSNLRGLKEEETRREVLTLDEVNALIQTECANEIIKRAAIFSVYTGLRYSDIEKLTWGEIEEKATGDCVINFKQKKTRGIEILPISNEALSFLGERKSDNTLVFEGLLYSAYYNKLLAKWVGLAGIKKDITFHSFRHTFATLQLTLGTDIYTVSKMLGHRDLKTTQIYAKIVDETKRTAANKIQLNITNWK